MTAVLDIKNFGPIKNATIEIKQITVLIGEQAAGKSTIAKLIALFNDNDFLLIKVKDSIQQFIDFLNKYNIHNYWQKDKSEINYKSEFFNCYISDQVQKIEFHNEFEEKYRNKIDKKPLTNEAIALLTESEIKNLGLNIFLKGHNYDSIYIPTERFLISILTNSAIEFMNNSLTLPKSVTQFGTLYQHAKNKLIKPFSIDFLNIHYSNEKGIDIIKGKNKKFNLIESASGYQSIIPLMLVMYLNMTNFKTIIVEEPELNLYPKTQYNLVNFMTKCVNQGECNLVITTHSPYILTSLNNLLFAGQIWQKNNGKIDEISKIIPAESWISPNKFNAYHVENGKVKHIFDNKTQLISETELDTASEIINTNFEGLMNIYKQL